MTRRKDRDRGAVAVEFALVVPLLLLLVFGIISYGYMLSFRQALSQAAAEGARAAAVAPAAYTAEEKVTAARAAVNEALGNYGVACTGTTLVRDSVNAGTCSVTVATCANDVTQSCVTVSLDYRYQDNSPTGSFPGTGVVLPENLGYAATAAVS